MMTSTECGSECEIFRSLGHTQ